MGITLVFAVLTIIGLVIMKRFHKIDMIGLIVHLVGGIGVVCCGTLILIAQCPVQKRGNRIEMEQKKASIEWGIKNITQVNSLELIKNIEEYNSDIIKKRVIHDNFWTSWFANDVAFEFETIDVNKIIIEKPLKVEVE